MPGMMLGARRNAGSTCPSGPRATRPPLPAPRHADPGLDTAPRWGSEREEEHDPWIRQIRHQQGGATRIVAAWSPPRSGERSPGVGSTRTRHRPRLQRRPRHRAAEEPDPGGPDPAEFRSVERDFATRVVKHMPGVPVRHGVHLECRERRRTVASQPGLGELRHTHELVSETFVCVLHMPKMANVIYELRDASGVLVALHERHDHPDGSKRFIWRQPNGALGLGGMPITDLPLYGIDRLDGHLDGRHRRGRKGGGGAALDRRPGRRHRDRGKWDPGRQSRWPS